MSADRYLHERAKSRNWQLRMMVPKAVRPVLGRVEFTRSLKVTNKPQARVLAYPILAEWRAMIAAAEQRQNDATCSTPATMTVPSAIELEDTALFVGYEEAGRRVNELIKAKARLGDEAYRALGTEFERRHTDALRRLHAGDQRYWIERARRQVAKRGWHLPEDSSAFAGFVETIARCGLDLFAAARGRLAGTDKGMPQSEYVQKALERREKRAKPGEGVLELFDRYEAQRLSEGRKRADSLTQDRKIIELLSEFVGVQRGLASIEKSELREWRNAVAVLPPAFRKRKAYKGLTMREAASAAAQLNGPCLSLNTINKYLSAVSALFIWAIREGYVENNPCEGLFYDNEKGKNARPPFSVEQLNLIISSPLFTGFLRDGKEYIKGDRVADDWRYWIPLICLFTGARIGEVAQLNIGDIVNDGSLWYFRIRSEQSLGQATKNNQSRVAPMHSMLRKIGFVDFVDRCRKGSPTDLNVPLFAELKRNSRGQLALPSRFWRTYLERIGVKSGGDGFGSHSFRHGLADQLRKAGCFDNEIAVAIGHKQTTVTSGYGQTRQGSILKLSEMIEGAVFEGVDFTRMIQDAG
jgi:integrase